MKSMNLRSNAAIRLRVIGSCLAAAPGLVAACGGSRADPAAVVREGPDAAILRISSIWEARQVDRGLRSAPSPVASFERQVLSRLTLVAGQSTATETLHLNERFTLREGQEVHCTGEVQTEVAVSYGIKAGEPAVELSWPELRRDRSCDVAGAPIPPLERPAGRGRFVLRSDQLVGVEPALEKRTFFPAE